MVTRVMRIRTGIILTNTLSNAYCEISLVVKAPHRTRAFGTHAIRALVTRDISQYTSDNIIIYIYIYMSKALQMKVITITMENTSWL